MPIETRADRAERLRDAVKDLVERSSWRQAAGVTEVSVGALRNFLSGSTPQETTMQALEDWAVQAGILAAAPSAGVRPTWKSDEEIGEVIRDIRKRCGFTQQRLADELGMPSGQADISKWESGKGGRPGYEALEGIARLAGKDVSIFQEARSIDRRVWDLLDNFKPFAQTGRSSAYEVDERQGPIGEAERWLNSIVAPDMLRRLAGTPTYLDVLYAAHDTVARRQWPAERKTAVQALLNQMIEDAPANRP
jgi:transcriptional regulator with XRE-family HTH domain